MSLHRSATPITNDSQAGSRAYREERRLKKYEIL